jgi:hypothetical protein
VSSATRKAFKHRILLAPQEFLPDRATVRKHASMEWRENSLYNMRRRYYFQVLKSNIKLKQRWWNNYCITRIGAPDIGEFLCPETFYVAQISLPADAIKFRQYWYWCRLRSFQILEWLWQINAKDYNWKLHQFLKGFIVTKRPILSEVQRYDTKASEEIALQILGDWASAIYRSANEEKIRPL